MDSRPPLPLDVATRTLLGALVKLSHERRDVREALTSLHAWLGHQLGAGVGELHDKVVQPGDGRKVASAEGEPASSVDLDLVVRRARWKAAALRFANDRRRLGGELTEDLQRLEAGLRTQRQDLPECFPWMLDGPMALPAEEPVLLAANAYDALARVAEATRELEAAGGLASPPADLLYLMAEAQSGLLVAVRGLGLRGDSDQRDLFQWLKDQTTRHRIYVDRHMRLDDPADPSRSADLAERFVARSRELAERAASRRERGTLLTKLRYHVERAGDGPLLEADRNTVLATLAHWSELGLPAHDRDLHALLAPLAEREGEHPDLLEALVPVLARESRRPTRDVDVRPAARPADRAPVRATEGGPRTTPPRDHRAEVAELLQGLSVSVLAGPDQEDARATLGTELGMEDPTWLVVPDLSDAAAVRALVDGDDSQLLMLGVRLESEAYGAFKEACAERGRLFVRLSDGFDPIHVARQVLRQVGWRLRDLREGTPAGSARREG